ncbi:MAG: DMT family transporter [Ferrovibrio sp.]|uniref:DMT family transporter n=1 Tax=Ferrovibrio sp. TaxID=1917215 RepID=UPI00391CE5D0
MTFLKRLHGSGNRRGMISFLLAVVLFTINEALCKLVYGDVPANQILALRGLIATIAILGMIQATGAMPKIGGMFDRHVVLRSSIDLISSYFYMIALFHTPIGNVMAIHMSSPLMMTAVVAIVLREAVGWRRWVAVIVGFLGVLLVVQPRAESFSAYSILGVSAAACIVVRDLVTKKIRAEIPSSIIILTNVGMLMLVALTLALIEGWVPMGLRQFSFVAIAALCIAAGYLCTVDAFRHAEVHVIVPLRYTGLPLALLLGWLVWGDVPNALASVGILLIVGSGLYVLHRERLRGKEAAAKAAATPPP